MVLVIDFVFRKFVVSTKKLCVVRDTHTKGKRGS
jgi:hypothetical protein